MEDGRVVRCAFCGVQFMTKQQEEPEPLTYWICGECTGLPPFERKQLQVLNRIADELFHLVEIVGKTTDEE